MDFDMEMDVPLPEELELLEESYRFQEQEEPFLDFQPPEPGPYDSVEVQPSISPPRSGDPPSPPETLASGHKRSRSSSDGPDPSDEKRGRIGAENEDEEEWLRYSPSKVADEREIGGSGGGDGADTVVSAAAEEVERFVWRFASEIDGEFIPVTAPSGGDRVYAKVTRSTQMEDRRERLDSGIRSGGLIPDSVSVLLQKAEDEAFAKALQASSADQSDVVVTEKPVVHERLWVDKYSPNSFTELLSDEQTNREVLLWLKQWDSRVFSSEVRSTSSDVLSALRRHSSIGQSQKSANSNYHRWNKGPRWNKENFRHSKNFDPKSNGVDNKDSDSNSIQDLWNKKPRSLGPPEQKVLLLCGPPGLGKTTLAHVAARHCGYRVVEINASDDRSSSTIETKILDVVQMNSVTPDSRPKCLVIDEIDGALGEGKGAVDVILKMVSADKKSDMGKDSIDKEGNPQKMAGKKGRRSEPLSRPVICICNDLYAPALRPLRQIAKVHVFVQPTVSRVVSRLKYICNMEGAKTSSIGLTALAQHTECDIRSCLNTLQFLQKKKETLNVLEVSSQVVGRKDMSKSTFDVWREVFQKRKSRPESRSNINSQTKSSEFDSMHALISSRGDYDLIMDGIHENILHLQYHDPVMQKTVKCLNSLAVSDLLHQYTWRTQRMHLLAYQPAIAISVHRLVSQVHKANIEWPKSYQRHRTTLIEKMATLRSWYNTIPPCISRHISTNSFVEESVSPLMHILSPPTLRPVAVNLLSEKEKTEMEDLIKKMVSYAITYKNVKLNYLSKEPSKESSSDSVVLAFDPPIADFVNFKGYRSSHYVLSLAMKQVLVHEVEKQRILQVSRGRHGQITDVRNKENRVLSGNGGGQKDDNVSTSTKNIDENTKHSNSAALCKPDSGTNTTASSVKPKSSVVAKRSASNFFDRFRKNSKDSPNTNNAARKEETSARDSRPLIFKFNEGFTNAVKRPVRIREFLL